MLVELLGQEGIAARTPGAGQAGLMGNLSKASFKVPLMVPADRADEAKLIVEALVDYEPPDSHEEAIDEEDDGPAPRKKFLAVTIAVVLPFVVLAYGAGHFYARQYGMGFLFLAVGWLCVALYWTTGHPVLLLALGLTIAADAWLAVRVIDRQNA